MRPPRKALGTSDGPVCAGISRGERQTMIGGPAFELTQVPRRFGLAPVRKHRRELRLGGVAIACAVSPEQELGPPTPHKGLPEWQERLPKELGALPNPVFRSVVTAREGIRFCR